MYEYRKQMLSKSYRHGSTLTHDKWSLIFYGYKYSLYKWNLS